jgi:hypothetical protein
MTMPEVSRGECHSIGIMGDCGTECPLWLGGECEIADEWYEDLSPEELEQYHEIYGEPT